MSPTLHATLRYLAEIAKEKQTAPVVCYWCNGISHRRHGSYERYAFGSDRLISVPRYYCKHDNCRRTFSILPHPFLRITRHSICLFQMLLALYEQEIPINRIARMYGKNWAIAARAVAKAKAVIAWIREEAKADASWGPTPCLDPARHWPHFIRMFAAKFYPKRYGTPCNTQFVNC